MAAMPPLSVEVRVAELPHVLRALAAAADRIRKLEVLAAAAFFLGFLVGGFLMWAL